MTQTALRLTLALALLTAAAVAAAQEGTSPAEPAADVAQSPDASGPRIVGCRIGWAGQYKVGHWTPMWVDVAGDVPASMRVEVTVPDPDGVGTTFTVLPTADAPRPQDPSGRPFPVLLYVMMGRVRSTADVALVAEGKVLDRATLEPGTESDVGHILPGLPSTAELLVSLGPIDLAEALPNRESDRGELTLRTVHIAGVDDLPTEWYGYAGIDTLVFSTGDLELCRQLAADPGRLAALDRWVKLGGRLVMLCGPHAPELIAAGEPLSALVPGTLTGTVTLTQTSPLEHFSQSEIPIARGGPRGEVIVAQLRDVAGQIDAFAGGQPTDLPLVVRAAHGMGELAFVAVDFAAPPLANWHGQTSFLRALLRPYAAARESTGSSQTLVTLGYEDLSGALRQRLGQSFPSVTTIAFPIVALLVIGYLLLLGPADYFLVHRCGQRHWLAWVTFPLLVVAASGGAYWLGTTHRGQLTVNQLELVDVDQTTGEARGTYWAALYSPEARRFDLSLNVTLPGGRTALDHRTLLSWLGLPGTGLGGMSASNVDLAIILTGYRFAPKLDSLNDVPLLTSSTKSLLARWTAPVEPLISADLAADPDGLVVGTLTNQSGHTLTDVRLLYGHWAYRLGDLPTGRPIHVDQSTSTIQVKTLIARIALGPTYRPGSDDQVTFLADRASPDKLLDVMMFYRAAGGYGFARLANQYQSYCDFSRLLQLGRAVLVANVHSTGSTLVDQAAGEPLHTGADQTKVVYRFILPVDSSSY